MKMKMPSGGDEVAAVRNRPEERFSITNTSTIVSTLK